MIISDKFIFIRIPRTASSSMEEVLREYHNEEYNKICGFNRGLRLAHITVKTLKNRKNNILNGKFKFAFVRNPFDRLVSYYHYYHRSEKILNFREFILDYLEAGKKLSSRYFWFDQSSWLMDEYENNVADYIGRFENLKQDFKKICDIINISNKSLPWLKKSKYRLPYTEYYDNDLIDIVNKKCWRDLKLFNYKYGDK